MNGFFGIEGPFYKWGTEVADIMILSLLWLLCSIPIFTIGASTTALFYVLGKKVRGEDPYISQFFFKSFKENFKQATVVTLILGVLWLGAYLYFGILVSGQAEIWIQIMGAFFIIQVLIVSLYIFPILSRFHMTIKNALISSFIFGNKHILTTIACIILFGVCVLLILTPSPLSIFAFGLYALGSSFFFQKVFTKHIATLDESENTNEEDELQNIELIENTDELEDQ